MSIIDYFSLYVILSIFKQELFFVSCYVIHNMRNMVVIYVDF